MCQHGEHRSNLPVPVGHSQPARSPWGRGRKDGREAGNYVYPSPLLSFFLSLFLFPCPCISLSPVAQEACRSWLRSRQASHGQPWRCAQAGLLYLLSATVPFLVWLGVRAYLGGTPVLPATPWVHCQYAKSEAETGLQTEKVLFVLTCFILHSEFKCNQRHTPSKKSRSNNRHNFLGQCGFLHRRVSLGFCLPAVCTASYGIVRSSGRREEGKGGAVKTSVVTTLF